MRFINKQLLQILAWVSAVAVAIAVAWVPAREELRRLSAKDRYSPSLSVSIDDAPAQPADMRLGQGATHELRVAVAPIVSMERSYLMYLPLADYLGHRLGLNGKAIYRRSYAEVNEMVRRGACDLAFICTYAFVQGRRDFGLKILVVPVTTEGARYHALILVRASSPAKDLADLRGKRFAFASDFSTGGWLYPAAWLKQRGIDPQSFFGALVPTGSHDRAVEAVAKGLADCAAVDDFVYQDLLRRDPDIATKVKVIQTSPWFDAPPVVVPANIDPKLEASLRRCLLQMDQDARGLVVLSGLGLARFALPSPGLYKNVEEMAAFIRAPK